MGHNVSVICKKPRTEKKETFWINKETLNRISLFYCKEHSLVSWLNDYSSTFSFFKIRLAKWLLSTFYKGTIFDKAIGVEKDFINLAIKVIKEKKTDAIFVSGAPFNLVYYTAQLKHLYPDIKIICDYRDPWLDAQNYGMKNLTAAKRKEEEAKQNLVFETVDYISAPNKFLLQEIKDGYSGIKLVNAQFIELPHAFDPDDVLQTKATSKNKNLKIIYAGTLYLGVDEYFKLLIESLDYHKKMNGLAPEISIYTDEWNKRQLSDSNQEIKFYKPVGDLIFEQIASADFVLIFLAHHNRNYLTSKFFEFMPYKKPYIYLGPTGFVSETIENEKLGFCLKDSTDLHKLLTGELTSYTCNFENTSNYTFDSVVKKFLGQIEFQQLPKD